MDESMFNWHVAQCNHISEETSYLEIHLYSVSTDTFNYTLIEC